MQRAIRLVAGLAALAGVALLVGCGTELGLNQEVAEQIAGAFADPTNGYTQEAADYGDYLFASEALAKTAMEPKIVPKGGSYTLYFSGNFGSFLWNADQQAYERIASDVSVSNGSTVTGTIDSLWVRVRFLDLNGDPVQLSQPLGDGTLLADGVVSMTYYRELEGECFNSGTGASTDFTATTDLTITGLADGVDGVYQSGSHTRTFVRTQLDRQTEGSLTFSAQDLAVNYDWFADGYFVTQEGTVTAQYDATITRPGSVTEVSKTAVIECHRQKTVTVTVEDAVVRVDITTGRID